MKKITIGHFYLLFVVFMYAAAMFLVVWHWNAPDFSALEKTLAIVLPTIVGFFMFRKMYISLKKQA